MVLILDLTAAPDNYNAPVSKAAIFMDNYTFYLKDSIEEIFVSTVKLLNRKGYVSLEKYFVDGTKIESAANKYIFREKRNTRRLTPLLMTETAIQRQTKTQLSC